MQTREDALYDLNEAYNNLDENFDKSDMGEEWNAKFKEVGRLIDQLCIEHDVACMGYR